MPFKERIGTPLRQCRYRGASKALGAAVPAGQKSQQITQVTAVSGVAVVFANS
jgi:hypothetical protein